MQYNSFRFIAVQHQLNYFKCGIVVGLGSSRKHPPVKIRFKMTLRKIFQKKENYVVVALKMTKGCHSSISLQFCHMFDPLGENLVMLVAVTTFQSPLMPTTFEFYKDFNYKFFFVSKKKKMQDKISCFSPALPRLDPN